MHKANSIGIGSIGAANQRTTLSGTAFMSSDKAIEIIDAPVPGTEVFLLLFSFVKIVGRGFGPKLTLEIVVSVCEWTVKTSSVRCPGRNSSIETATGSQRSTHSRTRRTAPTLQKFFYRRFDSVMSCRHVVGQPAGVKPACEFFFLRNWNNSDWQEKKKVPSLFFFFFFFFKFTRFVCVRSDVVHIYKE